MYWYTREKEGEEGPGGGGEGEGAEAARERELRAVKLREEELMMEVRWRRWENGILAACIPIGQLFSTRLPQGSDGRRGR